MGRDDSYAVVNRRFARALEKDPGLAKAFAGIVKAVIEHGREHPEIFEKKPAPKPKSTPGVGIGTHTDVGSWWVWSRPASASMLVHVVRLQGARVHFTSAGSVVEYWKLRRTFLRDCRPATLGELRASGIVWGGTR